MKKTYDYSSLVTSYFKKHLAGTKNVSDNTIHSYRDTFLIFNSYLESHQGFRLNKMNFRSFAKYVQIERPDEMALCQSILSIDGKTAAKPVIQYLSNAQIDALMEQPDISRPRGRRDLAMLMLLYDSAARVQELCNLKVCDVRVDSPAVVSLFGKGRKNRKVPITEPCALVLKRYIQENHLDDPRRANDPLFVNPQG